jgi:hypothetical protein
MSRTVSHTRREAVSEVGIPNTAMIADAAWCDMTQHHPGWSEDELLCHPREALAMCRRVRMQFPRASDDEICRALINGRKRGRFSGKRNGQE